MKITTLIAFFSLLMTALNAQKTTVSIKENQVTGVNTGGGEKATPEIVETLFIDTVWAANRVNFALQTVDNQQFIAYYDKNRMMTVASRQLGSTFWTKATLPNKLHWDSHNSVVMAIDAKGYIHVSGNMHVNPLVYFRSTKPYDVNSMVELNFMVGENEKDVTYPAFFLDKQDNLYYSYRSGASGNGITLINRFYHDTQKWERYIKTPLFDGIEKNDNRSAYHQFVKDKDGNFHYSWMWRWTPLVETCHQLCYATSTDMLHWKNAVGEDIPLPFRPDDKRLIVDDVPSKGGLHNGKYQTIITPDKKPMLAYTKYDEKGLTQLYLSHVKNGAWVSKKISNWDFRWQFIGGGDKMTEGASFSIAGFSDEGLLVIDWSTPNQKSGRYVIAPNTLENSDKKPIIKAKMPKEISQRLTDTPKLNVNLQEDRTKYRNGEKYVLKWETMGRSHGTNAPKVIPEYPRSALVLLRIEDK
ncbi:MAG: hypothetical protein HC817_14765 [Saprospiraceae bacterium]|nr:hypothetical protein [Saprospiraceae bacterium]